MLCKGLMPMPMEIPRLHSRDTTAPWNFGYIQWKIMLQIWFERIAYQSENQSEPPEPIWIPFLFHIQNLEDMLSKQFDVSVISPVQLWVLLHRVWWQQAGLEQAGLPRQPGRGSLTCDSKFQVELCDGCQLTRSTETRMEVGVDLRWQAIPTSPGVW